MDDNSSVFLKYSFKLRWIRQWYQSKKPQEELPLVQAQPVSLAAPNLDLTSQWGDFQFDNNFWQEMMYSDIFVPSATVQSTNES